MKNIFFILLGGLVGLGILSSCHSGETIQAAASKIMGGSSKALFFLECKTISELEIEFTFSQAVKVKSLEFEPYLSIDSIEDGSTVRVTLQDAPAGGMEITVDLLAEDDEKNTINVLTSFRSRNNRMPSLLITELCTEYSNPRTEYIEFKTLTAGNLGAMRVFVTGNTNRPVIYEFNPVEVKKDEYIVLHLRTVEEGVKNEYGNDLTISGGRNSSTGRDFWLPENTKLVHKAATAVYVLNQDDIIIDALMISETPDLFWGKDYFTETAEFLLSQNAWESADGEICRPADAVISAGSTNTRTICRNESVEDSNTAADWYVTVTSGATPGRPNNPNRFNN